LQDGDSEFNPKPITKAQDEFFRGTGRRRFGIEAGEEVVLRQCQVDVVEFGFNIDLLDFRTLGLRLSLWA
jgi:hypothetical protein